MAERYQHKKTATDKGGRLELEERGELPRSRGYARLGYEGLEYRREVFRERQPHPQDPQWGRDART